MYSSFDTPKYRPGRHRLVAQRTRTLTPPRAAGYLVGAAMTVLGITAAHQALSTSGPPDALAAGPSVPNPSAFPPAPNQEQPGYGSPTTDSFPAPDSPGTAGPRLVAQSTPTPQPVRTTTTAGSSGGQWTSSHSAGGSAAAPATSNPVAPKTATASAPAAESTSQPAPTQSSPTSSSTPAPSSNPSGLPLSQVIGTVTGIISGL